MPIRGRKLCGAILLAVVISGTRGFPLAEEVVRFLSQPVEMPKTGATSAIDAQRVWVGLAYTEDGGASWVGREPPLAAVKSFDLGAPSFAANTFFITAARGWLSGLGSVWMTDNGGSVWRRQVSGHIHAIAFAAKSGWLAAGDAKSVRNYTTGDLGQTWQECGSPWELSEAAPWSSASFLDARNGWTTMASYNERELPYLGGVARTFDGGCTWKILWRDLEEPGENLGGVQFVDPSFGWLFSYYGRLLETGDGGAHWRAVGLPDSLRLESAYLESATRGWILGSGTGGSGLFYTLNGGAQWNPISTAEARESRGMAREVPSKWGAAFLTVLRLRHRR